MKTTDPRSATSLDTRLGRNLRSIRLSKEMSQEQLAAKLGIAFQQVQKMEKGMNRIPASRIVQLADIFSCEIADLYRGLIDGDRGPFNWDAIINRSDLSIVHAYHAIQSPKQKAALLALAKTLSEGEANV